MKPDIISCTVSQLNRNVRLMLEQDFAEVAVTGELSNTSKPASGHLYFTLKDASAQLRCVYFKNAHTKDSKLLCDGQQVLARGRLSLYEPRGDYQLIVQTLSPAGIGALYQQFEHLKQKLEQQGLFSAERKKPLCRFPQTIAIITSPTGAALHDMLATLKRRYPLARVQIYPSEVQGKNAHLQLIAALQAVNRANQADVILLARGGGSLEDLWPFNEEALALAMSQSSIPIVSGVGHETDVSIADFVADLRAATPTAAAEAVSPDQFALLKYLDNALARMEQVVYKKLKEQRLMLSHWQARIASPERMVLNYWQRVDEKTAQLEQHISQKLRYKNHRLQLALTKLMAKNPLSQWQEAKARLQRLEQHLQTFMQQKWRHAQAAFERQLVLLHAVSPLATLNRGYALASHQGELLLSCEQVKIGDNIHLQLAKGAIDCTVIKVS